MLFHDVRINSDSRELSFQRSNHNSINVNSEGLPILQCDDQRIDRCALWLPVWILAPKCVVQSLVQLQRETANPLKLGINKLPVREIGDALVTRPSTFALHKECRRLIF